MRHIFQIKKRTYFFSFRSRGFSLIEIVVGVSILTLLLIGTVHTTQRALQISRLAMQEVQGGLLAEEGAEAMRFIRDKGWTNISGLSVATPYYVSYVSNDWATSTSPSSIGIFTRSITVEDVYRDASDNVATPGTLDLTIRKINVAVSWNTGIGSTTKSIIFYLADV